MKEKTPPPVKNTTPMPSNLIPVTANTAQILAARAAAMAFAQNVNAQLMQTDKPAVSQPQQPTSRSTNNNVAPAVAKDQSQLNAEKEAEQKKLEEEMRKRRERIEKWRNEKKLKEQPNTPSSASPSPIESGGVIATDSTQQVQPTPQPSAANLLNQNKSWNLEDDDDEEDLSKHHAHTLPPQQPATNGEDTKPVKPIVKVEEEDEEDPLDAYMKQLTKKSSNKVEVGRLATKVVKKEPNGNEGVKQENGVKQDVESSSAVPAKKVMILSGVAKSTKTPKKGNLMEEEMEAGELGATASENQADDDDFGIMGSSLQDDMDFLSSESMMMAKVKSKSDMVFSDHTKIYYRPFTKNFYVEVPEIANMTAEEVAEYREELEGIKVVGKSCPKPIKLWAQCGISVKILEILKRVILFNSLSDKTN